MKAKTYPKALHMYKLEYNDNTQKVLYACGMTHAYSISRECWPNHEIKEITEMDDSWKN